MLFRYYKGQEKKERWKVIEVAQEQSRLSSDATAFATVLAVSEKVAPGESVSDKASYVGPFYVDIDNDKDLASSLKTAKKVVNNFLQNGVPPEAINVWASGKKGFHITIPMECFCDGKPVERLPLVYRQMALALKLFETKDVDATVYSTGKGRMWRLENKERPDNGKYKIPLTVEELLELEKETCEELVSHPRYLTREAYTGKVSFLEALFKLSKGRAEQMEKPKGIFIDPNLKEALDNKIPPCVEDLKNFRNIKDGKGFNDVSLQFGKGVASFAPDDAKELIQEFADNSTGSTYNTPSKRKSHCQTAFRIAAKNSGYEWSCAAILSILKHEPCMSCPIAFIRLQQDGEGNSEVPEKAPVKPKKVETKPAVTKEDIPLEGLIYDDTPDEEEADPELIESEPAGPSPEAPPASGIPNAEDLGFNKEGLLQTDEGYCFMDSTGKARRISNFILKIKKVFLEYVPNLECDRRVGIQVDVFVGVRLVGSTYLEESNWASKSGFIAAFGGLANAAFYGKDDDVQKMKSALMENMETNTQIIRRVYSIGVHRQQIGEQLVFSYVEPGWSIDQFGNENLYSLSGKIEAFPKLKGVKKMEKGDEKVSQMLSYIMNTNQPHTVAQVLGWTMACFLKQHIFAVNNEFPLLSFNGPPGSGKTTTAGVFAALHGVDYFLENSPSNLPTATNFIVWKYISGSNSVPRLFEEFNKSKMQAKFYDLLTESFKSCWNQHSVQRGSIKNDKMHGTSQIGAHVTNIPMTGPVILCSEQAIETPSLVERTIQIKLSQEDRKAAEYETSCEFVKARVEWLRPFAKACYLEALGVTVDDISAWLEEAAEIVPYEISTRPRYSYRVTVLGLRFLERIIKEHELPIMTQFGQLREDYFEWLNTNRKEIANSKKTSEVDQILGKLATMAAMSESKHQIPWFVSKEHYLRIGDKLYIDPLIAHAMYIRYMNQVERRVPVIDSIREFKSLLISEQYVLSASEVQEGFSRGRPCFVLSVSKMVDKGIPANTFEEAR